MHLAENLRLLQFEHKLTLKQLSEKTGIPKSTIHNWASGVAPHNLSQLKKLANLFKITIDQLIFINLAQIPKT